MLTTGTNKCRPGYTAEHKANFVNIEKAPIMDAVTTQLATADHFGVFHFQEYH